MQSYIHKPTYDEFANISLLGLSSTNMNLYISLVFYILKTYSVKLLNTMKLPGFGVSIAYDILSYSIVLGESTKGSISYILYV